MLPVPLNEILEGVDSEAVFPVKQGLRLASQARVVVTLGSVKV